VGCFAARLTLYGKPIGGWFTSRKAIAKNLFGDYIRQLSGLLNPKSYCRFKYIHVYIFQRFELDAISAHTRLAEFFSICLG